MKSGWVKHFEDGQSETGFDAQIAARKASWRHGRLNGLVAIDIQSGGVRYTLKASAGEWWQSDTFVSTFNGPNKPGINRHLIRRAEYRLQDSDITKYVCMTKREADTQFKRISVESQEDAMSLYLTGNYLLMPIPLDWIGQWVYLEVRPDADGLGKWTFSLYDNKK